MSIWPPIVMIALMSCGVFTALTRFGEPKKADRYDIVDLLLAPAVMATLLWWGGFWEPLLRIAHG